jgi:predicted transcriptional regulator of viral defense system
MNFIEFREKMEPFRVFSVVDIGKMFPGFTWLNLVNWQRKGYIQKLRRQWYCFSYPGNQQNNSWLAANLIYQPSYISLETALSFYSIIPEAIYSVTSVTTKKTNRFETPLGNFTYTSIKEQLFGFGQKLVNYSRESEDNPGKTGRKILFADPEKAILDFFYINHQYNTEEEIEYLRFDARVLSEIIEPSRFSEYLARFDSKALADRILKMKKVYSLI